MGINRISTDDFDIGSYLEPLASLVVSLGPELGFIGDIVQIAL